MDSRNWWRGGFIGRLTQEAGRGKDSPLSSSQPFTALLCQKLQKSQGLVKLEILYQPPQSKEPPALGKAVGLARRNRSPTAALKVGAEQQMRGLRGARCSFVFYQSHKGAARAGFPQHRCISSLTKGFARCHLAEQLMACFIATQLHQPRLLLNIFSVILLLDGVFLLSSCHLLNPSSSPFK